MRWSGLVRARGLKHDMLKWLAELMVRARKSPWIETRSYAMAGGGVIVRARKSPWIETPRSGRSDRN